MHCVKTCVTDTYIFTYIHTYIVSSLCGQTLHYLTSSFSAAVITMATRGRCLPVWLVIRRFNCSTMWLPGFVMYDVE